MSYDGRVCDVLAVSRAFGDAEFKGDGLKQFLSDGVNARFFSQKFANTVRFTSDPVIATPAVTYTSVGEELGDEFIVIASDGLWYAPMLCTNAILFSSSLYLFVFPIEHMSVHNKEEKQGVCLCVQCTRCGIGRPHDAVLLCRDFWPIANVMQCASDALALGASEEEVADILVEKALGRYTSDNVAVIVITFPWTRQLMDRNAEATKNAEIQKRKRKNFGLF